MTLNSLLTLYGCVTLLNLVLMMLLHFLHDRRGYYLTAAGVWLGVGLAFVADGYVAANFGNVMHIFGIPLIGITMYNFAKLSGQIYQFELPLKKMAWLSFAMWLSGLLLHYLFQAPFAAVSFIICAGIVLPGVVASYRIFQLGNKASFLGKLYASIILLDAIHIMDYPFLRLVEEAAIFGFSAGLALVYIVSMLIPVVINRRLSSDMNEILERKVKERSEQLMDAREKLETSAKMSALGAMAGGVAHEINTPLALISMLSEQSREVLESESFDKNDIIEMTNTISSTVKRISGIIQGLRTFARDGGTDPFSSASVRQIIENTLVLCQEKMKHNSISVTVGAIPEECAILCREVQISQVLLNLVSNSCDAIIDLPEKWIKIDVERRANNIRILVTDSGHGIEESVQKKLFQPFFTTKEIGKGTGLGMSISKGIMEVHEGNLILDSECKNTRFIIECPIATAVANEKTG